MSPPERESRPGGTGTANSANANILTVREVARLSRRGRAELPCGHRGDPHAPCNHCELETDRQVEAAVTAVEHLDEHGLPALVDRATCRAMWKAGHRRLAAELHRRTTGEGV